MKHLGDITKIDWSAVEPVDVVTGGSPCQDLSVAGKRAGLAGERSGLYMEQIRCIKELRNADRLRGRTAQSVRPRYMLWENVPGAFSSNKGEDFQAVLTEAIRIAEPKAPDVPVPENGWPYSGYLYSEVGGWSLAWRTHDAQYWGVPQRRRRISLIVDFAGLSAGEILFKPEGLLWNIKESREERQEIAARAGTGTEKSGRAYALRERAGCRGGGKGPLIQTEKTGTINVSNDQTIFYVDTTHADDVARVDDVTAPLQARDYKGGKLICMATSCVNAEITQNNISPSLMARAGTGGNQLPLVYDARGNGDGKTVSTLTGDHQRRVSDYTALCFQNTGQGWWNQSETGATLRTPCGGDAMKANVVVQGTYQKTAGSLMANSHPGSYCGQDAYNDMFVTEAYKAVRRLTPLECERLQGYPDGWTDIGEWTDSKGKKHKEADSPRYKALGNSIALPFWYWLLGNISETYDYTPTLGSLFDGLGGFPLVWESINGRGTARWASEIEEFPIAVTKIRFGEE